MNVIDAAFPRDFHRPVGGPVVDDEPFDAVESRDLSWKAAKSFHKCRFFIITWNLDDELHGRPTGRVVRTLVSEDGDNAATGWHFSLGV